jgi:hypothetical protein
MLDKSPAPQMRYASLSKAMQYILGQATYEGRAWIADGYLVLYDIGSDWYTDKVYLIEQLILKVYKTDEPVTTAIAFLEQRARLHGCVMVAAGDTQVGYMTPKYQAAGYSVLGTQLYKEIAWDSSAS